jgi:peroxiredoxin
MKNFQVKILTVLVFIALFILNMGNVAARRHNNAPFPVGEFIRQMNGKPAPAFSLRDISGKTATLEDFKGKVVYMDVWATWCAPCLLQIKKSETLKKHFESNKDVVFLYISIDSDENKWKQTIEKRHIKGIHLISSGGKESDLIQNYQVPSIPRFVLIDREGNIADFNAKLPSGNGIVKDIEKLL